MLQIGKFCSKLIIFFLFNLYDVYALQWCKGFSRRNYIHFFPHPPTQKMILTPFLNMCTCLRCRPIIAFSLQQNVKLQHYMEKTLDRMSNISFCYVERGSGEETVIKVVRTALGYYCEILKKKRKLYFFYM